MGMVRPGAMPSLQEWIERKKSGPRPRQPFPRRRTRLKPRSDKKADWHDLYVCAFKWMLKRCRGICRRCRQRPATEGHHPFGQLGALILIFIPICRDCHDAIHGNPNKARQDGWLF